MPESSDDMLRCRVLTHVGEVDWLSMDIVPPDDITEELIVPFAHIQYVISAGKFSKIKLLNGPEFICTMPTGDAFTLWCQWQGRNPGK